MHTALTMFEDVGWMLLVAVFLVSVLTVLLWLIQHSVGGRTVNAASWALPGNLRPQVLVRCVSDSLRKLWIRKDAGVGDLRGRGAGAKSLLSSLFSFRSFRENCQRAWIRALNEQACRHGCSIQITFEDNLQLPPSASISQVTCMDQSACTMVLQCECKVDTVTFPVTVTQQSPADVSVDTYQVTIAPALVQLTVSLEEVDEEGLLVSWSFSQQPLLSLAVSPCRVRQEEREETVDLIMIEDLVENAIVSTQAAMMVNLKACDSPAQSPSKEQTLGWSSPSPDTPVQRVAVRQLRVTGLTGLGGQLVHLRELCCALDLDPPAQEARTGFLPAPVSPGAELEWNEDVALDLDANTKGLRVRLVERSSMGEKFLPGQATLPLDSLRRTPIGQQVLSVNPGLGLPPTATVILELVFLEKDDAQSCHHDTALCASPNPTQDAATENPVPNCKAVAMAATVQTQPFLDCKSGTVSLCCTPHRLQPAEIAALREPSRNSSPTSSLKALLSNGLDPMDDTAIRHLLMKQASSKRGGTIFTAGSKDTMATGGSGCTSRADTGLQGEHSPRGNNSDKSSSQRVVWQDCDEVARSTDDLESETGSTGALETRSLKDHKVGFLRSGTKLLFRRRAQQKDPSLSRSHEDLSNRDHNSVTRKKSGSFSRRLIKRFSFHSRSKNKTSANINGAPATSDD